MSKFWYFMGGMVTGVAAVIGTAALYSTLSDGTSSSSRLNDSHDDSERAQEDDKSPLFARSSSTGTTEDASEAKQPQDPEAATGDPFTSGPTAATA